MLVVFGIAASPAAAHPTYRMPLSSSSAGALLPAAPPRFAVGSCAFLFATFLLAFDTGTDIVADCFILAIPQLNLMQLAAILTTGDL